MSRPTQGHGRGGPSCCNRGVPMRKPILSLAALALVAAAAILMSASPAFAQRRGGGGGRGVGGGGARVVGGGGVRPAGVNVRVGGAGFAYRPYYSGYSGI